MTKTPNIDYNKYINYLFIAYALSFPLSKAAISLLEVSLFLLWILEGNWKEKFNLYRKNLLSITLILLISFSLLTILWHGNTLFTLDYVSKYKHLFIIFIFYSSLDKKYIQYILSAFLLGMFISELVSYAIYFELIEYKNILPSDPTPFMSHMSYSTLLTLTSMILLIKLFTIDELKYKIMYGLFYITVTLNLFINGGKTGQIILIVLIISLFFIYVKNKFKAIIYSLTILSIIFSIAYNFSPNFKTRINQLKYGVENIIYNHNYEGVGGIRASLWIIGLNNFQNYYIKGAGIGKDMNNVVSYSDKHNFNTKHLKIYADNHNAFLTLSIQLGIAGLIISILLIYSIYRLKFISKEYASINKMFLFSFVLFSFTHNTLHTMNPMVFFALFSGLFNAISKIEMQNKTW